MVAGRTLAGVCRGAGGKFDRSCISRGEERRQRGEGREEGREEGRRRETSGAADMGNFAGRRRGLAIDAAGNRHRSISLVERWKADCVYGFESGKQERERAEGKVQRVRSVRGGLSTESIVGRGCKRG